MSRSSLSKLILPLMIGILVLPLLVQHQPFQEPVANPPRQLAPLLLEYPSSIRWFYEFFNTTKLEDDSVTTVEGWGSGTLTSPREFSIQQLDYYNTSPNSVRAVSVQGRAAVIAGYQDTQSLESLQYLNVTTLNQLGVLDTDDTARFLSSVIICGDTIYAGADQNPLHAWSGWLGFFNVSASHEIRPIAGASQWLDGGVIDLEIQGHFLYAALANSSSHFGLGIWNIVDPRNPIRIPNTYLTSDIRGIAIEGDLALIANGQDGLQIVNISSPHNLGSPLGTLNLPGITTDILLEGTIAFATTGSAGVHLIDVTDPTNPQLLGTYDTVGNAEHLALQGKTLFVADGFEGLTVLDVINPTNPLMVTRLDLPYTWDIQVYGGDLLVATDAGLYSYRLGSGFTTLAAIGSYTSSFEIQSMQVIGDTAYIAAGSNGLVTLNVSDPAMPLLLDQDIQGTMPFYHNIEVQGRLACVSNYFWDTTYRGLLVYDIGDPANLEYLGRLPLQYATDLSLAGELAFITDGPDGIVICNVSNPTNPTQLISFDHFFNATALAVQGYNLFVADTNSTGGSLYTYSLLDINTPTRIGSYEGLPEMEHSDLLIDGDIAYSVNNNRLLVWNICNPADPILSSIVHHSSLVEGIAKFGPYLLTSNASNVNLFDMSKPNQPLRLINKTLGAPPTALTMHGDYTFFAFNSGLSIVRHFKSAGSTFHTGVYLAQSLQVAQTCDPITWVTLLYEGWLPKGTTIMWECSSSIDFTWYSVNPFTRESIPDARDLLYWRAFINSSRSDRSVHISKVSILFQWNHIPEAPILYDPGGTNTQGSFIVQWSTGFDREGIQGYRLQMSYYSSFISIVNEWLLNETSLNISKLKEGTYYFRVLLIDIGNRSSPWSNIESITVNFAKAPTTPMVMALVGPDDDGIFWVHWTASSDPDGTILKYEVQLSQFEAFSVITSAWTIIDTSLLVSGLSNGTYYLRVRSIDNEQLPSSWSNPVAIQVQIPAPETYSPSQSNMNLIIELALLGLVSVGLITGVWLWNRRGRS